ncbi:hypothetical protein ACFU8I_35270 [Streptomyces sp. NPDC057540]|uniref:hypothetical protein n=1 Tax=Streptomyces sp. NPDC057540 TaxID=3346160 RepID=UPI0036BED939
MEYEAVGAELTAAEDLPGLGSALGQLDCLLVRDGAHWIVARNGTSVEAGRISDDPGAVFAARRGGRLSEADGVSVSPLPGGGLAVSGRDSVTVQEADGTVRWALAHRTWPSGARGACAPDPSGTALLAVVPPARETDRTEVLVALDPATGVVLAEEPLPTSWGTYEFQQPLGPAGSGVLFLDAAQGQEEAYSLLVSLAGKELVVTRVGGYDEPFTGSSDRSGAFLTVAVAGELLTRYDDPAHPRTVARADDVLPDGLVFLGRPGFLDATRVLAAVGEDPWEEECRHVLLDATDLRPRAGITYPRGGEPVSRVLPLGDGTWLTFDGDTVRRWRTG